MNIILETQLSVLTVSKVFFMQLTQDSDDVCGEKLIELVSTRKALGKTLQIFLSEIKEEELRNGLKKLAFFLDETIHSEEDSLHKLFREATAQPKFCKKVLSLYNTIGFEQQAALLDSCKVFVEKEQANFSELYPLFSRNAVKLCCVEKKLLQLFEERECRKSLQLCTKLAELKRTLLPTSNPELLVFQTRLQTAALLLRAGFPVLAKKAKEPKNQLAQQSQFSTEEQNKIMLADAECGSFFPLF